MHSLLLLAAVSALAQGAANQADQVRRAYQQGESAVQSGDLAAAEQAFLRVLQLEPRDVGARVNLGVVCMREKKWDRALGYLSEAEKLAPQVTGIRLNIGLVHYRQADYASAIPAFESVVKQEPDSVQARRLLGLCYLFEERYADSANELEQLWPTSNSDLSYLYSLAVAAGNSGKADTEKRAMSQLMAAGKDSALMHLLLGKAYLAHEAFDSAYAELQRADEADSKLPMLHYNLGVLYRHRGELDKAKAEFLKDEALEPEVAYNYDQLGLLRLGDGENHEAELYFLDAVRRDARLGTSWFGLAKAYKQQKLYPDALKALREAGLLDPKSASVHYLRAQVFAATGQKNRAESEFAVVQSLKKETIDKLEHEISGTKYRDPEVPSQ